MFREWFGNKDKPRVDDGVGGSDSVIDLRAVIKAYSTPAGEFLALKGIDLTVAPGSFVAVVGKSGSGKSTLMNMITGIDRPTSGEVIVAGTAVHRMSEGQIASWRGRNVGVVFQFFQLLPTLTLVENVMLPMSFCNVYRKSERRAIAVELLDKVGIADQRDKLPTTISGGQQQRVAIARAMANDPPLIVADEPTGNLDSHTADAVFHLFEELVDSGKTILMVTHDDDLAQQVTRTVVIADGEIAEDRVQARHRQPMVHGGMDKREQESKKAAVEARNSSNNGQCNGATVTVGRTATFDLGHASV